MFSPATINQPNGALWKTGSTCGSVFIEPDAEGYRQRLCDAVERFSRTQPLDRAVWARFAPLVETQPADVNAPADWAKLRERVLALEQERGTGGNRLLHYGTGGTASGMVDPLQ